MTELLNPFPSFYVYVHFDPETQEILYVGMGKGPRAYAMKTIRGPTEFHYGHRSPEHSLHLDKLYEQGYLPHEWIRFEARNLEKKNALKLERELINSLKPTYNRPHGSKVLKFNLEEVHRIKKLRKDGLCYSQIAEVMGCSNMVAHRIVNDLSPRYKEMLNA